MVFENLAPKFQPGDRVVLVRSFDHLKKGDAGTFLCESDCWPELGVRWDKRHADQHICDGHCEDEHGWYVPLGYLAYAEAADLGEPPDLSSDINCLFGL